MTSVRNRIKISLVSAGALMLAPGCKPKVNEYKPPPPAEVTVATPVEQEVTEYINYTGVLEPFQTVELRARVSGFLEKINFKPGGIVKKGDLLFVIDKRTFIANVDQAKAQLASAKSQLESAEADAKLAEDLAAQRAGSDIDRITKIAKRDGVRAQVAGAQAALARV